MPFFKKATTIHPTLDPAMGDEDASRLRGELQRGNWTSSHELLERTQNWDDRQFLVAALSDWPGKPSWLEEWVQARHDSSIPYLMRGARGISWAWEARGGGKADTVSEAGFDTFHQRLMQAEDDLMHAARLDEADPTPWVYQLITIRGLEQGIDAGMECFDQMRARDPWSVYGHVQMLQLLTEKWGGSHRDMFDFARAASAAAPAGSLVHRVIADAHSERWLYLRNWEQNRKGAEGYFRQGEVKREILDAVLKSIWAPEFSPSRRAVIDRNMFAFCFTMMGDSKAARREFNAIGPIVTSSPWAMIGEPVAAFMKAHDLAS